MPPMQINQIEGYKVDLSKPFFHEFVVKCPAVDGLNDRSAGAGHHRRL